MHTSNDSEVDNWSAADLGGVEVELAGNMPAASGSLSATLFTTSIKVQRGTHDDSTPEADARTH